MQPDDAATPVIAFPRTPETRLRVALRQLDAVLAEQRAAVASFRRETGGTGRRRSTGSAAPPPPSSGSWPARRTARGAPGPRRNG
jgi:hypothetical protein